MSGKVYSDNFYCEKFGTPRPRSAQSAPRRRMRGALIAIAAGAIMLSAVAESYAQRGGFGMSRGGGMNMPSTGMRLPGGEGARFPGGGGPRFPGGGGGVLMIPPGGFGPGGFRPGGRGPMVVYEDDDEGPRQRRVKRGEKKQKQQQAKQKQNRVAGRGGFNPPPRGEQRFVQDEVLLNVASGTSAPAIDAIARRHRLTRLDLQHFEMTQRSLARLRINDGRPVATVIRSLEADARVLGAQPNYRYALQQDPASPPAGPTQYSLAKMQLPQAHPITTGGGPPVARADGMLDP